jgi:hypothetical protein
MNILFHNGAAVYHHRKDIADFLQGWPDLNKLLKSIKFDIKEKLYLAGCRYVHHLFMLIYQIFSIS